MPLILNIWENIGFVLPSVWNWSTEGAALNHFFVFVFDSIVLNGRKSVIDLLSFMLLTLCMTASANSHTIWYFSLIKQSTVEYRWSKCGRWFNSD